MKIYRRLRTWILAILLIVIVVLAGVLSHSDYQKMIDWKVRAAETIEHNKTELENPDIPEKFKKQMKEDIALQQYMLDHNYPPTDNTLWGGMLTASGLIIMVTLFTVIIAGDMVAGEFTWGTIKLLLIRPASRAKILIVEVSNNASVCSYFADCDVYHFSDCERLPLWLSESEPSTPNCKCSRASAGREHAGLCVCNLWTKVDRTRDDRDDGLYDLDRISQRFTGDRS